MDIDPKEKRKLLYNLLWIGFVLGAIYVGVLSIGLEDLGMYVERAGIWGPVILILGKIATIVFAPLGGSPLYPIAGALFGPFYGFLYMFIGDALGASIAFWISRRFGRSAVTRFVSRHGMVMVERILMYLGTAKGMLEARIYFIAFPELISYAAGLTHIPFWTFVSIHMLIYAAPIALIVWLGDAIVGLSTLHFVGAGVAISILAGVGAILFYKRAERGVDLSGS